MDNLAHTLIGIGVARAGLSRRFGPGTTLTLALSSNLPDIDIFWTFFDPWDRFMLRRTHSHALVVLPALAALFALVMRRRYPAQSWRRLFGLSLLGVGLHVFFDLVNSFGVVLFWPFSPARFEMASVFIIDLIIWLLMIAAIGITHRMSSEEGKPRIFQLAVGALGFYVVICLAAHARAETQVREELAKTKLHASALRLFPEPFGPQRFRAAARVGDAWYVYLCSLPRSTCELREIVPTNDAAPRVAELRATPRGQALERFMAAPVWTLYPEGRAEVYDLRFRSLVVPRGPTFQVEFPAGSLAPIVR